MVTLSQIKTKLTELIHQKNALIYEKILHEQKVKQIEAGIEVINGAASVYQDWGKDIEAIEQAKPDLPSPDEQAKALKKVLKGNRG